MLDLDSKIMDIVVTRGEHDDGPINIKFLAVKGGQGPELVLPLTLARTLLTRLEVGLA